jgi:predicted MFS family arabinose efflux permease
VSTSTTALVSASRVLAARTSVAWVFGLNGLAVASWFARVPAARDALGLSSGRLGLLLLAMSAGAVVAMPMAGAIVRAIGAARSVTGSTLVLALGLGFVGLATAIGLGAGAVGLGLFAVGFGSGLCDVAMNVEAADVERRLGRTIMPRFHAAWSVGTVIGAALGAVAAHAKIPVAAHLGLVALFVSCGTAAAARQFLPVTPEQDRSAESTVSVLRAWLEPRTLLIGLFVFIMAFTEGTANDWLAVAVVDGYGMSEAAGAAVFGVFVAAMTGGRTFGTLALDRWGRVPVLLASTVLAGVGAFVAVLGGNVPLAVLGVVLWGTGAALGFPMGMSAAADDEAVAPARVSVVAVIGYTAFLAGPPVVGLLGDHVGTLRALLVVPLMLLPALALAPVLGRRPRSESVDPSGRH